MGEASNPQTGVAVFSSRNPRSEPAASRAFRRKSLRRVPHPCCFARVGEDTASTVSRPHVACTKMVKVGAALPGSFSLRDSRWRTRGHERKERGRGEGGRRKRARDRGSRSFSVWRRRRGRTREESTRVETGDGESGESERTSALRPGAPRPSSAARRLNLRGGLGRLRAGSAPHALASPRPVCSPPLALADHQRRRRRRRRRELRGGLRAVLGFLVAAATRVRAAYDGRMMMKFDDNAVININDTGRGAVPNTLARARRSCPPSPPLPPPPINRAFCRERLIVLIIKWAPLLVVFPR